MKKIGLLCLALVLALGALGVGYAMWWDQVVIQGTVTTGTVDIEVVDLSGTYVYKDLETGKTIIRHEPITPPDPNFLLVASATADDITEPPGPTTVSMTFDNIFPTTIPIAADVVLHYKGTIPVHVELIEGDVTGGIKKYLKQKWYVWEEEKWVERDIDGIQLHYCDKVMLVVYLDPELLQEDGKDAQGLKGTFTKIVNVHQWNED